MPEELGLVKSFVGEVAVLVILLKGYVEEAWYCLQAGWVLR